MTSANKYYTNDSLFKNQPHEDKLYVVCNEPIPTDSGYEISIPLDQKACVLKRNQNGKYENQLTVEDIRKRKSNLWLLSGGVILFDQCNRIAVGLRNGNAADPFAYSNIGAGRCDQLLKRHCKEELASEIVLFVKDKQVWNRICFDGESEPFDIDKFIEKYKDIKRKVEDIKASYGGEKKEKDVDIEECSNRKGSKCISVKWTRPSRSVKTEKLYGYIFKDTLNRTIEFRQCLQIDLSKYEEVSVFYKEGPGFALWKTVSEINGLVFAQKFWQERLVTPLLEYVASV